MFRPSFFSLCDALDYSLPGSSVHRIHQARILEWVVILLSRESSRPRDWTFVSSIGRRILYTWATRWLPFYKLAMCILGMRVGEGYETPSYPPTNLISKEQKDTVFYLPRSHLTWASLALSDHHFTTHSPLFNRWPIYRFSELKGNKKVTLGPTIG